MAKMKQPARALRAGEKFARAIDALVTALNSVHDDRLSDEAVSKISSNTWEKIGRLRFKNTEEALWAHEKILGKFGTCWDDTDHVELLLNVIKPFLPKPILKDLFGLVEYLDSLESLSAGELVKAESILNGWRVKWQQIPVTRAA